MCTNKDLFCEEIVSGIYSTDCNLHTWISCAIVYIYIYIYIYIVVSVHCCLYTKWNWKAFGGPETVTSHSERCIFHTMTALQQWLLLHICTLTINQTPSSRCLKCWAIQHATVYTFHISFCKLASRWQWKIASLSAILPLLWSIFIQSRNSNPITKTITTEESLYIL